MDSGARGWQGWAAAIDDSKKRTHQSAPERERAALARLIEEYQQAVGSYLFHLVGESDVALALTRETFVHAYRAKTVTQPGLAARPWLYRTATRLACSHLRRHQPRSSLLPQWRLNRPLPAHMATKGGERALVQSVLSELPFAERAVLLLCDLESLPYDEAAAILKVSAERLRERLRQARTHFHHAYLSREAPAT